MPEQARRAVSLPCSIRIGGATALIVPEKAESSRCEPADRHHRPRPRTNEGAVRRWRAALASRSRSRAAARRSSSATVSWRVRRANGVRRRGRHWPSGVSAISSPRRASKASVVRCNESAAVARLALNCSAVVTGESTRSVMAFTAPTGTSCSEPIQATAPPPSLYRHPRRRFARILRRLVEAVVGRQSGVDTERLRMSAHVGGGKVSSTEDVETGKIDAAVVTHEAIPGEVDVADDAARLHPPAVPTVNTRSGRRASPDRAIKRTGGKGRCCRPDAVDAGAGIGAIGDLAVARHRERE